MVDIIRLHGDPHKQTQTLLPWYANGTLDADEAAAVESHLSECAECRAELKSDQTLAQAVAELPTEADRGWAAMREQMESRKPANRPAFLRRPVPIGWALAAQAASLALILGVGGYLALRPHPAYRALGAPPAAQAGNIVVIFKPTASEQQLRGVLVRSGARLVDGPTASDAYVLRVAPQRRAAALARLRADAQVVLAEPIDGDAQP